MARKLFFIHIFILLISFNIHPKSMTIDKAIELTADELGQRLKNSKIAILNLSSKQPKVSEYIIEELNNAIVRDGSLTVVERGQLNLALARQELYFNMSGEVSDESAQRIGHFIGAQSVLTGSFTDIDKNKYQFRVRVIAVETGALLYSNSLEIKRDSTLRNLTKEPPTLPYIFQDDEKLWSIGLNIGTSFATPLFIGNLNITLSPFPYTFVELGAEIGLIHGKAGDLDIGDVGYYSLCYYGNLNYFMPFYEGGGWYIGAGGGYMDSRYNFPTAAASAQTPVFSITTGVLIGWNHLLRISYTLRTNFSGTNHRIMAGYSFRIID